MSGAQGIKASNSSWGATFPGMGAPPAHAADRQRALHHSPLRFPPWSIPLRWLRHLWVYRRTASSFGPGQTDGWRFLPGCWRSALLRCPEMRKAAAFGSGYSVPLLPVCFPFPYGLLSAMHNTPPEWAIPCSGGTPSDIGVYRQRILTPLQTACCNI